MAINNSPTPVQTVHAIKDLEINKLDKAGGTVTGALTLHADPEEALQAATKQYVDTNAAAKAPATHASQHASGGTDAVTPAAIGAVASSAVGAASGVASLDTDSKVTAAQAAAAIVAVTASITLGSTHYGRLLYCSNASAITITIPTGLPIGTEIEIYRAGAGTVTLAASGVTIQCKETAYGIADQYTAVVLKWVASDTVSIIGNVG